MSTNDNNQSLNVSEEERLVLMQASMNNETEADKSILALSIAIIGFIITVFVSDSLKQSFNSDLIKISIILFSATTLIIILWAFRINSKSMEALYRRNNEALDKASRASKYCNGLRDLFFIFGLVFFLASFVFKPTDQMNNQPYQAEHKSMNKEQDTTNEIYNQIDESFSLKQFLPPQNQNCEQQTQEEPTIIVSNSSALPDSSSHTPAHADD